MKCLKHEKSFTPCFWWREHCCKSWDVQNVYQYSTQSTAVCGKSSLSTWCNMTWHHAVMDRLQFLLQLSSSNHLAHLPLSSWRHHHGVTQRRSIAETFVKHVRLQEWLSDYLTIWLSCSRFSWVEWFWGWLHQSWTKTATQLMDSLHAQTLHDMGKGKRANPLCMLGDQHHRCTLSFMKNKRVHGKYKT